MVRRWRQRIDDFRVRAAIERAEAETSGEIVVSIAGWFYGDVERAAQRAFERLGVVHTKRRNGVLVFVVPLRHRIVILGDIGVHERVGDEYWYSLIDRVTSELRIDDLTTAIVHCVERIGATLAQQFPRLPDDVNELGDLDLPPRLPPHTA